MADQKPPRLAGEERETLCALLQFQRESLVRKVTGLDDDAARRSMVDSGTTLLWLIGHMAQAETAWILHRFAGTDAPMPDDSAGTLAAAIEAYRATWPRVDAVVSAADLDATCPGPGTVVNLRWILAHLLEETSRHAGHADILRELIDGQTGR